MLTIPYANYKSALFKILTFKLLACRTHLHDYEKCIYVSQGKYVWEKLCLKAYSNLCTQNAAILHVLTIPHRSESLTLKHY